MKAIQDNKKYAFFMLLYNLGMRSVGATERWWVDPNRNNGSSDPFLVKGYFPK